MVVQRAHISYIKSTKVVDIDGVDTEIYTYIQVTEIK